MNIQSKIISVLSAFMLTASAILSDSSLNVSAADKIKIMPLGDSITYGMADEGGYRKYLWQELKAKGYENIDFVGPEGKDSASFSYNGQQVTYDDNHAGYSGYTITNLPGGWMGQLNGILETMQSGDYITKYAPDIILLQIGTNDINNGHLDGSEERLHKLLDYLREKMPADGTIFLTTIPDLGNMGWGDSSQTNQNIAKYNDLIQKVANDYAAKHVVYADIHSTINASVDLADGVHPNAGGYEKMGKYWAEQLDGYLGQGSSPGITPGTTPGTNSGTVTDTIRGDVNKDGFISAADLSLMKQGIRSENKDSDFIARADVNQSGVVNKLDAEMMQNYLLGKVSQFEKGASEVTDPPKPQKENKWDQYQETADARAIQFYKDSIYSMGNTYRLVKKLEAAENGEKLTMAYLGGSITEMGKYTTPFSSYVKSTFAKGGFTEVNAGLSGTSSVVGLVRSEPNVISKNPDIVFVEFSVNDHEDIMYKKCFESVIKRFLDLPNEPAVIILIHRAKSGFSSQAQMVPVGENFNIPIISMDNALTKAFNSGYLSQGDYFSDDYHPHDKGGNKQYCWGGPDAELGYYQDASGELNVSITGSGQFTIWGIGLIK